MSGYAVARLDEIDEISDGRCPWRPVRLHFGIMAFGVNAWTGRDAGDRIINEHDESEEDSQEELYLVQRGRATFELDGERVDAPAGTLVFARGGVKRTAFAEEAGTTISEFASWSRKKNSSGTVPSPPISSSSTSTPFPLNSSCVARAFAVVSAMPVMRPAW